MRLRLPRRSGHELCYLRAYRVGRPVARGLQDGWTAEVLRLCTTGTRNACSFLYGACWRAARALGYTKLVTYTLASETGGSLRASGWRVVAEVKGREWTTPSRPRDPSHPQDRLRWELAASGENDEGETS